MDLFEEEQQIYENAINHIKAVDSGAPYDFEEFRILTKEYYAILKQFRRMTKLSDRTADNLHESNLNLTDKVHYDTLTGIYNRRFMEERFEKYMRLLAHTDSTMSVMIMDIDSFKKYNDTYGHSAGDECLKAVAKAIANCVICADDFVARYGGEEFVVVLLNKNEVDTAMIAEKILEAVRGLAIPHQESEVASCVTISIGATTLKPKQNHKFMDYIKRADIALYDSKKNGKNRYTYIKYEEEIE